MGRVIAASSYTSKISLLCDNEFSCPGRIVESGALGIIYGEGENTCMMRYIDSEAKVKLGDTVVTSELGRIFPPNQKIGIVTRIYGPDEVLFKAVQIKPSVDFSSIQFVILAEREK